VLDDDSGRKSASQLARERRTGQIPEGPVEEPRTPPGPSPIEARRNGMATRRRFTVVRLPDGPMVGRGERQRIRKVGRRPAYVLAGGSADTERSFWLGASVPVGYRP
jgi:hypothetical protein